MKLFFKTYGEGPPLILLHGLFGRADNWHGIATRLADQFQLVAPDLRNHGQSPHHAAAHYPAMAGDVAELMDALGWASASVLGHSMGGKVAMQLALSHPERVQQLIVADMAPRAYAPRHTEIFAALLALDVSSFTSRTEIEAILAGPIPSLKLRQFLLKNLGRGSDGTFGWKINLAGLDQNYPQLRAAISGAAAFNGPARFIRGGRSDYILAADEPEIHAWFPRAEVHTLPEAGHWVHADAPEEFTRLVREFLRGMG